MITDSLKRSLKKRSKLTKCYYKNRQKKSDYEKLEILCDLCEKSNLLNNFFGSICTSVKNLSALSLFSYRAMPEQHRYFTEEDI